MENWKIQKIGAMTNEVGELHPLLKQIFTSDPSIARHEYTHGNTEMGADFVLARIDPTLNDETYVGVIVKCGDINKIIPTPAVKSTNAKLKDILTAERKRYISLKYGLYATAPYPTAPNAKFMKITRTAALSSLI